MARVREAAGISVPATSANLGPAFDCAGLALDLRDELRAEFGNGGGGAAIRVSVTGEGAGRLPDGERHLVVRAMRRAFDAMAVPAEEVVDLTVTCRNAIPHGRGMGSSAAAIIGGLALARALVIEGEARLDDQALLRLAVTMETHPDNIAAALLGGFTLSWFDRANDSSSVRATRIVPDPRVRVALAIPRDSLSTASARRTMPDAVPLIDAAFNVGRAAVLVAALSGEPELLMPATADRLHQEARRLLYPDSMALVDRLRADGTPSVISGAGPSVLAFGTDAPGVLAARLRTLALPDWRVIEPGISSAGVLPW